MSATPGFFSFRYWAHSKRTPLPPRPQPETKTNLKKQISKKIKWNKINILYMTHRNCLEWTRTEFNPQQEICGNTISETNEQIGLFDKMIVSLCSLSKWSYFQKCSSAVHFFPSHFLFSSDLDEILFFSDKGHTEKKNVPPPSRTNS